MIVVPIAMREPGDIEKAKKALNMPFVDLVELRLDYSGSPESALGIMRRAKEEGVLQKSIVTFRAWWEGGASRVSDEDRVRVLIEALREGAHAVDIELLTLERLGRLPELDWDKVILSFHGDENGYNDGIYHQMLKLCREKRCYAVKLALSGRPYWLRQKLLWALSEALRLNVPVALMPVGCCLGLRLLLYALGSKVLYACLDEHECTAEGQPVLTKDTDRSLLECAKRLREFESLQG